MFPSIKIELRLFIADSLLANKGKAANTGGLYIQGDNIYLRGWVDGNLRLGSVRYRRPFRLNEKAAFVKSGYVHNFVGYPLGTAYYSSPANTIWN
ncbi:hypothetical protein FACS189473_2100 [Spirochaetia bacterium]|nr:hypothetical protein FACS189473_2100 [Spirochaetia bacterium]